MTAFDPDAYIASISNKSGKSSSDFDPDAYIASISNKSPINENMTDVPEWGRKNPRTYGAVMAARNTLGPLIEGGAAVAGGIFGTGAGTVASPSVLINPVTGAIAGSSLAYTGVKGALDAADEILGLKQPRNREQVINDTLGNLGTGALYEAGGQLAGPVISKSLQLAGKGVNKLGGFIADIGQLPTMQAAKLARSTSGEKLPEVINALRTAPQGVTASQALANQIDPVTGKAVLNTPELQALLKSTEGARPTYYEDVYRGQDAARLNALIEMAQGGSQTAAKTARKEAKNALNELTTPMRETELSAANTAGKKAPFYQNIVDRMGETAKNKVEDVRRFTAAGQRAADRANRHQRVNETVEWLPGQFSTKAKLKPAGSEPAGSEPYMGELSKKAEQVATQSAEDSLKYGEARRFAQGALDSLKAHSLEPLESAIVASKVNRILQNPKFAGNDVLEGAVRNVVDDIKKWTSSKGIIDADALNAIRKNSVNAAIQKLRPGLDQTAQNNLASSVLSKVKPIIDDAIEQAGGTGYKAYLETHAKGMDAINRTKLGAEAMRLYKDSPDKFIRLVEGESPDVVEKIFGSGNYDLVKSMGQEASARLSQMGKELRRDKDVAEQGRKGAEAFDSLLKEHSITFKLPNMLNAWVTGSNKVLGILERQVGKKTVDVLAKSAKDAKSLEELLTKVPAGERIKILKILNDPEIFRDVAKITKKFAPVKYRGGVTQGIAGYKDVYDRYNQLSDSQDVNALNKR